MSLSYKEVAEILKIIDASSCDEVVLELGDTRLIVRRGGASPGNENPVTETGGTPRTMETQTQPATGFAVADSSGPGGEANVITMRSPMVGTFYCRPSPGEAPFVDGGSKVSTGDPLCLIEVMKLYTTIEATAGGVIESILVEDGELVGFDQPLFVIRSDD